MIQVQNRIYSAVVNTPAVTLQNYLAAYSNKKWYELGKYWGTVLCDLCENPITLTWEIKETGNEEDK
jgi:hypothetical protein